MSKPLMSPEEWAIWEADAKRTKEALDIAVGKWENTYLETSLMIFRAVRELDKAKAAYAEVVARAEPREYDAKD